jgi:hypothetical protein
MQACGPLDQVHRKGMRLCTKMTYLFNPYFCVNKLEKQNCEYFLLSLVLSRKYVCSTIWQNGALPDKQLRENNKETYWNINDVN